MAGAFGYAEATAASEEFLECWRVQKAPASRAHSKRSAPPERHRTRAAFGVRRACSRFSSARERPTPKSGSGKLSRPRGGIDLSNQDRIREKNRHAPRSPLHQLRPHPRLESVTAGKTGPATARWSMVVWENSLAPGRANYCWPWGIFCYVAAMSLTEVEKEALALPENDRARLAVSLLETLPPPDAFVSQALAQPGS